MEKGMELSSFQGGSVEGSLHYNLISPTLAIKVLSILKSSVEIHQY
jgi:hypothetical protein